MLKMFNTYEEFLESEFYKFLSEEEKRKYQRLSNDVGEEYTLFMAGFVKELRYCRSIIEKNKIKKKIGLGQSELDLEAEAAVEELKINLGMK